MKRKLATIMVLALLISAIGGIAIFSSAEAPTPDDPYRILIICGDKYSWGYGVLPGEPMNPATGIKQTVPTLNVATDGTLSITGYSGTTYTSADMDGLVNVLIKGDWNWQDDASRKNIAGVVNQAAGWNYLRFGIVNTLKDPAADTAAITASIKAFLTAYKAAEGSALDGIITDGGKAAELNEVVFSAVKEVYPDITMSAYDVAATYAWQLTGGAANAELAGNTSAYSLHTPTGGTGYTELLGDILCLRDIMAASNGRAQLVIGNINYSNGDNAAYYGDAIAHAALMDAGIVMMYEGTGSYQAPAAATLRTLNPFIGFSDRQPLNIPNSKNDLFIISGMYAGGRNIYLVTPKDKAAAQVTENGSGVVIDMGAQSIAFAGGKLVTSLKNVDQSFMVETTAEVTPVINSSAHRFAADREVNTYPYTFDSSAPFGYWWKAGPGEAYPVASMVDGKLVLAETSHIICEGVVPDRLGSGLNGNGLSGMSVEFTLPAGGMPEGSILQLMRGYTGGGALDGGFIYKNGTWTVNLYGMTSQPMEMYAELEPGKTYTAKRLIDRSVPGNPVHDFYIYDDKGTLVAEATGLAGDPLYYDSTNFFSIGFLVVDAGTDPVIVDNFNCFKLKEAFTMDLSVFDAATGNEIDAAAASDKAIGYRLDWTNRLAPAKALALVAGHYDADGNLVSEDILSNLDMATGTDGFVSGKVEVKEASVRVYLKKSDAVATPETLADLLAAAEDNTTIILGAGTYEAINIPDGITGLTIIGSEDAVVKSLTASASSITGLTLKGITFTEAGTSMITIGANVTDLTITGCTFTGASTAATNAISMGKVSGTIAITNNTFTNCGHNAIQIGVNANAALTISDNDIEGTGAEAVNIYNVGANATVTVTGNTANDSFESHNVIRIDTHGYEFYEIHETAVISVTNNTINGVLKAEGGVSDCVAGEAVKENETASSYDMVTYCTICEKELSRETIKTGPVQMPDVKITTSGMVLKDYIGLQMALAKKNMNGGVYDTAYYTYVQYAPDGTEVGRGTIEFNMEQTGYVGAEFPVLAWSMTDTFEVTLFWEVDGVVYQGASATTSVRTVAMKRITSNNSAKNLCIAMLNYGAAVQTYFKHNNGDASYLANSELTAEQKTVPAFGDLVLSGEIVTPNGILKPSTKGLNCQEKINMQFAVKNMDMSAYEVRYTIDGVEQPAIPSSEFIEQTAGNATYTGYTIPVIPQQMRSEVVISIYNAATGEKVYGDITCSVVAFVKTYEGKASESLMAALMAYGDAAIAHFN